MHFMLKVKVLVISFPFPMQTFAAISFNGDFLLQIFRDIFLILGFPIETR